MTANRLRVYPRYVVGNTYKAGFSVKVKNKTDAIFSSASSLLYSDLIKDIIVEKKYVFTLSSSSVSIYDREQNERVGLILKPENQMIFNSFCVNKSQIYVGTSDGIYSIPKSCVSRQVFELKPLLMLSTLGGKNIKYVTCNHINSVDYLVASHEGGLSYITNDGEYVSNFSAADTTPGDVYLTSGGQIYYGHGVNGLYFISSPNRGPNLNLSIPLVDYLYSSLPSKTVIDLAVSENSISGTKNTIFVATSSGVSIISESLILPSLSTIRNISIANLSSIFISRGATTSSGYLYYSTNNSSTGIFAKYNLATDTVVSSHNINDVSTLFSNEITSIKLL